MAETPHSWDAYARLQSKLSVTASITFGDAIEAALNVIHQPEFSAEGLSDADMIRRGANAARQERHRSALRRQAQAAALDGEATSRGNNEGCESSGVSSLDDQLHARCELRRIAARLHDDDWELLTSVALGAPYRELAALHESTSAALRSRVCRLRTVLMSR